MKDTQEELERLEQELLEEETQPEENVVSDEELLTEVIAEFSEPAIDEPETVQMPEEDEAYSNYANDYGQELQDLAETGVVEDGKKKNDKAIIGLMIAVCVLCAGIIGILLYWLNAFLI